MLRCTDDSGFLAVVVPASYATFVASDWKLDQLFEHFHGQMKQQSLLLWGTGLEGFWNVDVRVGKSSVKGFQEVSGPLRVDGGSVLLTNYESLTVAAQFEDVRLPEKHQKDNVVKLPNGDYCCRVVQMFDPLKQAAARDKKADFVLEFMPTQAPPHAWTKPPWFTR